MRTIEDMIECRNAPIAPGADPEGFRLADCDPAECRFPTGEGRGGIRFCAMPVEAEAWRPGAVNGCYCAFHRGYLARQPNVVEDERRPLPNQSQSRDLRHGEAG